jgi:hypothetical protein
LKAELSFILKFPSGVFTSFVGPILIEISTIKLNNALKIINKFLFFMHGF